MKTLRQLFAVIVLTLMIAVSSSAGDMHTTAPAPQPTPTPAEGEVSTTFNGNIHTGDTEEANAGEAVAADVLSLVQVVLSLL
jgi:hypothetical protein